MRTVPRLCELYPGICLTTEEKARKNLSQGSRRVPVGTMKTEYTEQSAHTIRIHLYCNNRGCLHVSAICCYIQRCNVSWNIKCCLFIFVICFDVLHNTSCKEQLPEDNHNSWPKHVAGYAVYNTTDLHILNMHCWLFLIRNHQCMIISH